MKPIAAFLAISSFVGCVLADDRPTVTYPKDRQKIGEKNDPACPPDGQPCYRIEAEGNLPKGTVGAFAVEPMAVSPRMFIQPHIHAVADDGSVSSTIYLGEEDNGAKQSFKIYLLACRDESVLGERKSVLRVPAGCVASSPVKVYRLR